MFLKIEVTGNITLITEWKIIKETLKTAPYCVYAFLYQIRNSIGLLEFYPKELVADVD